MWGFIEVCLFVDGKDLGKNKSEDTYRDAILQKGIDFSRRNSYSDLSESQNSKSNQTIFNMV